jgi:hypothetical protein
MSQTLANSRLVFGYWDLFIVCDLGFGAWDLRTRNERYNSTIY